MRDADDGYLLIADITGYTMFLKASELEHARGILEDLFSAMLAKLHSPFVLSNIQGDAILAHARANQVADGHNVINTVEELYFGFAHELEHMINNTTCTCAACRNMSNLDLKLLVHFGRYVEQSIGGRTELGGSEVILIHRLLKNTIAQGTGIAAYAAFTDAAVAAAGVAEFFDDLPRHTEAVPTFDAVAMRVVDMQPAWQVRRSRETVVVGEDDELWFPDIARDINAPADRCWHYLVDPELRNVWSDGVVSLTRTNADRGRLTPGTIDHCAHGDGEVTVMTIRDARPYDHITCDVALPLGGSERMTIFVAKTPNGTRVTVRAAKPTTANKFTRTLLRALASRHAARIRDGWLVSLENLAKLAERDAPVIGALPQPSTPIPDAVRSAVEARLSV